MTETVAYLQAEAESNWLQKYEPEVWAKTHKYLLLSGYLTLKMTGKFADSVGCRLPMCPLIIRNRTGAVNLTGNGRLSHQAEMLPDLVPPAQQIGVITAEAAAATGIPEGLPLIAAAADKACEVIGAGCLDPVHSLPFLWHHRHHQYHPAQICGSNSPDSALSFRDSGSLFTGNPDLPRVLDGILVQT